MHKPYSFRDDASVPSFDDGAPIAVMDAECAVCSWGAQTIHRLDQSGTVRICPIQTPLGCLSTKVSLIQILTLCFTQVACLAGGGN